MTTVPILGVSLRRIALTGCPIALTERVFLLLNESPSKGSAPDGSQLKVLTEGLSVPVAYQQNGIDFFEAPTKRYVDVYLPGDENAQLRQGYFRKLDEIEKARTAVYGDIDAVVTAPSSDEAGAVDDLIDTVPTTIAGLLAFMTYLAKARARDEDMLYAEHLEPLVDALGKVAAILS